MPPDEVESSSAGDGALQAGSRTGPPRLARGRYAPSLVRMLAEQERAAQSHARDAAQPPQPNSKRRAAIAFGLSVVGVSAGLWFWLRSPGLQPRTSPAATSAEMQHAVPLTAYPGSEMSPSFSPDGNQVAFTWSGPDRKSRHIYVKLVGENDALQLTKSQLPDDDPAWSPDGRSVAFMRELSPRSDALMIVPVIAGSERTVTEIRSTESCRGGISWHPGGQVLAISEAAGAGGPCVIELVNAVDGTKRPVTTGGEGMNDAMPAFSPDGRSIAFVRQLLDAGDLYLLPLSDTLSPARGPERLTFDHRTTLNPAWTANGRSIVYSSGLMSDVSLWRIRLNASGMRAAGPEHLPFPRWCMDAGHISSGTAGVRDRRV